MDTSGVLSALEKDHSYVAHHQKKVELVEQFEPVPVATSTPRKSSNTEETLTTEENTSHEEESSSDIIYDDIDPHDLTYQPENLSTSLDESTISETDTSLVSESKYIVFRSQLMELVRRVMCSTCSQPSPPDVIEESELGSCITVTTTCISGHIILKWASQPISGRQPIGNILLSGAILCSGETYERVKHMCHLVNIKFPSKTTYNNIQKDYLLPEIQMAWQSEQAQCIAEVNERGGSVWLAGDGRCDSPGFSAKYCLYSHIDMSSNKILSLQLVQVTETGSSSRMEVCGYERGLDMLIERGVQIEVVATDRHVQVRKKHREKYAPQGIVHEFDVYHMSSTIRKKIKALSKKPKLAKLGDWSKSILNHLWWSASTCDQNPDLLVEKWTSIVYHGQNQHCFPENTEYKQCAHGPLEDTPERRTKWLKPESREICALESVVLNKRLLKDTRLLSRFCHTGMLEVFHSSLLKYAPKRLDFDYAQMTARLQLAALDHNCNVNREQAVISHSRANTAEKGELRYRYQWSKASAQYVVQPIKVDKDYSFATDILEGVVQRRVAQKSYQWFKSLEIFPPILLHSNCRVPRQIS